MKNRDVIEKLAQRYDSFYLYDQKTIKESMACLQGFFPQVNFLYSMKCNPHKEVLNTIFSGGFGADAASLGEVLKAEACGLGKEQIYYSAPGKLPRDIEGALDKAIIIADSIDELHRIDAIANGKGIIANVGIRVNPNFTLDGNQCAFNKFGIDQEQVVSFLTEKPCRNLRITGLHVYLKSQELRTDALMGYHQHVFQMIEELAPLCDSFDYVNFGSGIGVPYNLEDEAVDLTKLSQNFKELQAQLQKSYPDTKIMIETGRFLTCKAGIYVTKVIDRKVSCGKNILILRSTMNGFVRPSMDLIFSNYGKTEGKTDWNPVPVEPFYTCKDAFQFETLKENQEKEVVTIFGNLCAGIDAIARDIQMPHLEFGDVVIINNAGAYAAVITPMQFSSQDPPAELFLTEAGTVMERA